METTTILHPASSRGHANHGWLNSYHTFSFANYFNPERVQFGALRVLNDDTVAAGMGFGTHPHDNMEIISIPLEGDLAHKDSMGNEEVIAQGDVQVMSAGTGVYHSEYNKNSDRPVKFLQIWVFPNQRDITPRYDQMTLNTADRQNKLQLIISPQSNGEGLWIQQDAWFSLGKFDAQKQTTYTLHNPQNGVYAFVLNGQFELNGQQLHPRDGMGLVQVDELQLIALTDEAEILLMEVPMM